MAGLDWEKDRRNHLPKQFAADLRPDEPRPPAIRAPKSPLLIDVKRVTAATKSLMEAGKTEQLREAALQLRVLMREWTTKTGKATLEIQNAETVLRRADAMLLRRSKRAERILTIGPPARQVRHGRKPAISVPQSTAPRKSSIAQARAAFTHELLQIARMVAGTEQDPRKLHATLQEQFLGVEMTVPCPKCRAATKWRNLKRHLVRQHGLGTGAPEATPLSGT